MPRLKPYRNRSRHSGVSTYAIGKGFILVHLVHLVRGGTYEYTDAKPGRMHVRNMQMPSQAGIGLSTLSAAVLCAANTRANSTKY
ncbi:hypothetical protein EO087_13115 [Dyella sp. M7H15-1]|uniref:hypothetical protein n=1 Tax=Dyella sp. M7H15-1 TaxID=2501295 RepID=UPI0010051924|nr:hypothetical protein [Dyella sp. M7H15-1]QAU24812.1 hypothetical protein EO087_13115 [Dyella sp. M7H15-1]